MRTFSDVLPSTITLTAKLHVYYAMLKKRDFGILTIKKNISIDNITMLTITRKH